MFGIFVQLLPFVFGNAHREIIGIVGGLAGHRQHFARVRIHRHHRALFAGQILLGDGLQVVVDGQLDRLAGNGVGLLEPAHFAAHAIDDHAAHAVHAHQLLVVLVFQAGLADDVAGTIAAVARFDLIRAHFAHVSARRAP